MSLAGSLEDVRAIDSFSSSIWEADGHARD